MRTLLFILVLWLPTYVYGQNSDCEDAEVVCDGTPISYNPMGPGNFDFDANTSSNCINNEFNAAWYYFEFNDMTPPGTLLEFTINPDVSDDFDFTLWGPSTDTDPLMCGNLGLAISCNAAGLPANTGMSNTISGPTWESAITVNPGDGFWLLVDNFGFANGGFSLDWGTETAPYLDCDADPDCTLQVGLDDDLVFCPGVDINLVTNISGETGSVTYVWTSVPVSAINFLDDPNISNPVFNAPVGETGPFVYTVTVTDDLCSESESITFTTDGSVVPIFDIPVEFCVTDDVYILPNTSNNGYTGVWSPSVIDPSNGSITYVFTVDEGQDDCVENTEFTPIIINIIEDPIFSFHLEFCEFDDIFNLPTTSDNGITGNWVPTIVDPGGLGVGIYNYTFTPDDGQCANDLSVDIEILEGVIPLFDPIGDFCESDPIFILPVVSNNGITGSWNVPQIDPATDGTFITIIFTADNNLYPCSQTYEVTVFIIDDIEPVFEINLELCDSDMSIILPNTSLLGYTGSWDNPVIDPFGLGGTTVTSIFTPDPNQADCLIPTEYIFVIEETITPVFDLPEYLCDNDEVFLFPETSNNGISGDWNPLFIDPNLSAGDIIIATFTPDVSFCSEPIMHTIEVLEAQPISFDLPSVICESGPTLVFPDMSIEGVNGVWTFSEIDPSGMGGTTVINTFLVDSAPNECYEIIVAEVTIVTSIEPIFNDISLCENDDPYIIPSISNNGLAGDWNPSVIDPSGLGGTLVSLVFTPENSGCVSDLEMDAIIEASSIPVFSFNTTLCTSGDILVLPDTDDNGILGTWVPAIIDPSVGTGTVFTVFTPDVLYCASPLEISFLIEEGESPIFEIETAFCELDDVFVLPLISNNGIAGTWNPNVIDPSVFGAGTHPIVFTPENGDCYGLLTLDVEVQLAAIPSFDLVDTLCTNDDIYNLPTTSLNGMEGIWNIPSIDPTTAGVGNINLIFTPNNDCTESFETTVLIGSLPVIVELTVENPSNCGAIDGAIIIEATGSNLSYSIDGGIQWSDNPSFSNLLSGIYNIVVSNSICTVSEVVSMVSTGAPLIDSIIITPLSNCDLIDASIEILAQGIDLEYSIDGGGTFVDNNLFEGLSSGSYAIIVRSKDAPDCTTSQTIFIEEIENTIIIDVSLTDITDCGLMNGQIVIEASGNSLQYSIDGGQSWQSSNTFSDLDVGSYAIVVQSELYDNCTATTEAIIMGPMNPIINEVQSIDPSLCTSSDGSIIIIDHQIGLEYSIDNGNSWQIDSVFMNLQAGEYELIFRFINATNCFGEHTVLLLAPTSPVIDSIQITQISDCGLLDGSVEVFNSNTELIEYSIDGGLNWSTNSIFLDLGPGNYEIIIRFVGAVDCMDTYNFELIDPECGCPDLVIVDTVSNITCYDFADGYAELLSITGGSNYNISWDNGDNGTFVSGLDMGWYTYTIQYNETCEWIDSIEIEEPNEMLFELESSPTDCPGIHNGTIYIIDISGGSGEILYALNNEDYQSNPLFLNLSPEEYMIVLKDENDCYSAKSTIVEEGTEIPINFHSILPIEIGDSIYLNPLIDVSVVDSFYWAPAEGILNPGEFVALVSPLVTTDYELTIYNGDCIEKRIVRVEVIIEDDIYVPNVFNPSDPNGNNYFYISTDDTFSGVIKDIFIYDRWGGLVYSSQNLVPNQANSGWDGKMRGELVLPGVYIYLINYEANGNEEYLYGDITVIR